MKIGTKKYVVKRLIIFPFQYLPEKKLKQENLNGNQNNISFKRLIILFNRLIISFKRLNKSFKRDICALNFVLIFLCQFPS